MRWCSALDVGPIVYRLGRHSFKVQRRVRLPLGPLQVAGCRTVGEVLHVWMCTDYVGAALVKELLAVVVRAARCVKGFVDAVRYAPQETLRTIDVGGCSSAG